MSVNENILRFLGAFLRISKFLDKSLLRSYDRTDEKKVMRKRSM